MAAVSPFFLFVSLETADRNSWILGKGQRYAIGRKAMVARDNVSCILFFCRSLDHKASILHVWCSKQQSSFSSTVRKLVDIVYLNLLLHCCKEGSIFFGHHLCSLRRYMCT